MRKKVTSTRPTIIKLKKGETAVVFTEDEGNEVYLHDQPTDELLSLNNYKAGLTVFAFSDQKTADIMIKNFDKAMGDFQEND